MDREEDHNEDMDHAIAIANANEDDEDEDDDDDIDMNNEIGLGNVALDPEEIRLINGVNVQINNRDNNNNNNNVNANDDGDDDDDDDDDDEEVNGNGDRNDREQEDNDNDNEEEDEEDNDDEEEDDENENDDEEDIIEGGCANEGSNKLSTGCAMYLIFECKESPLENSNDGSVRSKDKDKDKSVHPIYQVGSKVQIGMEKTTRLSAVFARYTEFANNYNCQSDKSKSEANAKDNKNKNKNKNKSEHEHAPLQICPSELEFSHCSILLRTDTAETSALMKKDRIAVRRVRTETRKMGLERLRAQQNSDRDYFKQMKGLLAITSSSTSTGIGSNAGTSSSTGTGTGISKSSSASASASNSDKKPKFEGEIVLDCRGRVNQQQVLNTYVRAHEGLIAKRCNWLALRIDAARGEFADSGDHEDDRDGGDHDRDEDHQQQQEQNDHDMQEDLVFEANQNQNQNNNNENNINNRNNNNNNNNVIPIEDDDDDGFQIEIFNRNMRQNNNNNDNSNAVPIAIDADADADTSNHNISRDHDLQYVGNNSPINKRNTLRVVLDYPPEAVRLLLEYCYTNRVISLGSTAFRKSYKPINKQIMDPLLVKFSGPASPFPPGSASAGLRSTWPKMGKPTVELSVALAGIQLAEEANMSRLSLMCEIAASQLVTPSTCLEALVLCEQQYRNTGNRLTHLRQAVMLYHVIGSGPKGVDDLSGSSSFKRTLKEKRNDAVPSLLMGIMETVKFVLGEKDNKHNNQSLLLDLKRKRNASMYADRDNQDFFNRTEERRKSRARRWKDRSRSGKIVNPYGLKVEETQNEVEGFTKLGSMNPRIYPIDDPTWYQQNEQRSKHHRRISRRRRR